jgi:hypothetical protein
MSRYFVECHPPSGERAWSKKSTALSKADFGAVSAFGLDVGDGEGGGGEGEQAQRQSPSPKTPIIQAVFRKEFKT